MRKRFALTHAWRTSSWSGGGGCVQVRTAHKFVQVRDSKNPGNGALRLTPACWRTFLAGVPHGPASRP